MPKSRMLPRQPVTLQEGPYPGLTFNIGPGGLPSVFRIPTVAVGAYILNGNVHPKTGHPSYQWLEEAVALNVEVIAPFGGV